MILHDYIVKDRRGAVGVRSRARGEQAAWRPDSRLSQGCSRTWAHWRDSATRKTPLCKWGGSNWAGGALFFWGGGGTLMWSNVEVHIRQDTRSSFVFAGEGCVAPRRETLTQTRDSRGAAAEAHTQRCTRVSHWTEPTWGRRTSFWGSPTSHHKWQTQECAQVRAYYDRALSWNIGISYRRSLRPVVLCPYLCSSDRRMVHVCVYTSAAHRSNSANQALRPSATCEPAEVSEVHQ